jgi:pimeloyl-ACP methyl ester carboxylesterase
MARVAVNGVTLAVREWAGRGPTLVLVHGLTANHTCWESLAAALAGDYRLLAWDLRGRGESDKPDHGYSLAGHSADLAGLLGHYRVDRVVLVGHSLGAAIALHFAVHHPERVGRLVLVDGGFDVRAEVLDSLGPAVGRLGIEYPSLDFYLQMLQGLPLFAGRWNEHLTRYFTYDVERGPGGGVRSKVARPAIEEELASLGRERLWVLHRKVQAPTLLLRAPDGLLGETDCLMTQDEAEAMRHAIPRCTLVVVPGTNHYTILLGDNPLLQRTLRTFLAAP